MKSLLKKVGGILIICSFLFACTEDYFDFEKMTYNEWRPQLAVPLVNSELDLEDIVIRQDSNGNLGINSDGILEVIYRNEVINTLDYRAFDVPEQIFGDTFNFPIPPINGGQEQTFNQSTDVEFEDTTGFGVEIDSMILKAGKLVFTIENEYPYEIDIIAKFRTFTDANGDTLKISYTLPAATPSNATQVRNETISLAGYKINFTEDAAGNPAVNKIPIDAKIAVKLREGVGALNGEELRLVGQISDVDFKEFYGFLGSSERPLQKDTFAVALFKNFTTSNFFISNPTLKVSVYNSLAVPLEFNFLYLSAINSKKNSSLDFVVPDNLKPLVLKSPRKYGGERTEIILDTSNSNLDDIVSFLLNQVGFDSELKFNPSPMPPPTPGQSRNFFSDTSDIGLDVEFKVPFQGRGTGFFLEDTIDFNFEMADELSEGLLRVEATNGFPMEVDFQLTFLNENDVAIDSLFQDNLGMLVPASIIDINGETISRSNQVTDISIDGGRLKKLTNATKLAITSRLSTPDAASKKNVTFRAEYKLNIRVGLKAGILIN